MSRARVLAIGLALLVLGLATVLGLRASREHAPNVARTNDAAARDVAVSTLDASSSAMDAPRKELAAARAGGLAADPFAPEPAFGPELVLLFVDEDGRALPRTSVRVLDPGRDAWCFQPDRLALGDDPIAEVERRGVAFTSDDEGRLRLARFERPVAVLARSSERAAVSVSGERAASARASEQAALGGSKELAALVELASDVASPCSIVLRANHALDVRVRDEDGAPLAGVPLELCDPDDTSPLWRGATDEQGRARVERIAIAWADPELAVRVTAGTFRPALVSRFVPSDFDTGPVEFVVPRGDPLELRLVDARGAVVPIDGDLTVTHGYRGRERPRMFGEPESFSVPVRDGIARLTSIVPKDETFSVVFEGVDWPIDAARVNPLTRRVDLPLEPAGRVVRLRVLGPAREPWTNRQLVLRERYEPAGHGSGNTRSHEPLRTDAEGRIVLLRSTWEGTDVAHVLVDPDAHPPLFAYLPTSDARGLELVLQPAPLALAGRVVTERGAALPRATVMLSELGPDSAGKAESLRVVRTDANGRFEAFGYGRTGPVAVSVRRDGRWLSFADGERTTFPRSVGAYGDRDVTVRVVVGAELDAWILVDPAWLDGGVKVALVDPEDAERDGEEDAEPSGAEDEEPGLEAELRRAGDRLVASFRGLEAGEYALRVSTLAASAPVFVPGIVIPAEGLARDPRLEPLDLRGALGAPASVVVAEPPTLRFQDDAGRALEHGVWCYSVDGEWHSPVPWLGGAVTVFEPFDRIAAWSPGRWLVVRPAPRADEVWTLPSARRVVVHVDVPASLRTSAITYRAVVELDADSNPALAEIVWSEVSTALDARDEARFELPGPGRWQATVEARWDGDGGVLHELETFVFELGEHAAASTLFEFAADEERWLAVLREDEAPLGPR
ncbi:MAG: carboxypeptidase regulatory-like domain-containing protein [Planctomycetes bacterium]|nr:carboxypeptidase regulatory-like domain-containing protein [Planctomycetota bacterium]